MTNCNKFPPQRPRPSWLARVMLALWRPVPQWLPAGAGLALVLAGYVALSLAWPSVTAMAASGAEEDTTADTREVPDGTLRAGKVIPATPPDGAKTPPCTPRTEVRINGACWVPHAEQPPCPSGTYEHGGKCYVKVAEVPKPRNTVEE